MVPLADPADEAELPRRQLRSMQHDRAPVTVHEPPCGRLPGIHGLRTHVVDVVATSEFDDHEPGQRRLAVADRPQQRDQAHDHKARSPQLRRTDTPRTGPT